MAFPGPDAGGDFLGQMMGDLLKLMGGATAGGARVDLARMLAQGVASGGVPEANVDPAERIRVEELARVAELHVDELTAEALSARGVPRQVTVTTPGAWAWQTVDDWGFLLDAMSASGGTGPEPAPAPDTPPEPGLGLAELGDEAGAGGAGGDVLASWLATMGPVMAAMQLGSAVGHLARVALGAYELPVPRSRTELVMVPANARRFAEDWSLDVDQVRLWVCLREVSTHAVLSRPPVAARLRELLTGVVQGTAEDAAGLVERFRGMDLSAPDALASLLGDPGALAVEPSPQRRRVADELAALCAAVLGYVEHVVDLAAGRLLGGRGAIAEAWRRRQVDRGSAERSAELLLGVDLGPALVDRGAAFVTGVHERAGDEGLVRLWSGAAMLPTPAEVDAPGLWLERTDLTRRAPGEAEGG
ncbi:MAG TPA: zinc-dependent metalloprotease [Acidimicrobiales bacterium]|nr:zinc-dependent metalloprotease [Acidimicrobiales bacterium]